MLNVVKPSLLTGSVSLTLLIAACEQDCAQGFTRSADGICRADTPCPAGSQREEDLACHSTHIAQDRDTGEPPQSNSVQEESRDDEVDTGGLTEGPGRIWVSYEQLKGVPAHGFVVFGTVPGETSPVASFCQIILADPMTVEGYLVPYDGESNPCPSTDDAKLFEANEVVLNMFVAQGTESEPILCDQRLISIAGDQVVDFSDVVACN